MTAAERRRRHRAREKSGQRYFGIVVQDVGALASLLTLAEFLEEGVSDDPAAIRSALEAYVNDVCRA